MSATDLKQRLSDLFGYIRQGKIIGAMNDFYDKDTAIIEREMQFMSGVKAWKAFEAKANGTGDNITFYECTKECSAN